MNLSLRPTDTFFFRDGKPFSRGEQTEATGIFPPYPSTIYGALRSAYISEKGWDKFINEDQSVKDIIGTTNSPGNFRVKGVFLERKAVSEFAYFPLPMDLVSKKHQETENREAFRLDLVQREFSSNIITEQIMITHSPDLEYRAGALLDSGALKNYLLAERPDTLKYRSIYQSDYLAIEPKVGIERNLSQSEEKEGRLYRIDMMRLRVSDNYRLLVDLVNIDLPKNGLIKLGGENRAFSYEQTEVDVFSYSEDEKNQVIDSINKMKKFRLYCATPTIWNKNANAPAWKANWMDGEKFPGTDIKCKIITAAIGKHIHIGGWDIANKCPKAMYRAVPAGAVYYLELLSGTGDAVFDALHYQNVSLERANEGFGLTLVGIY